MGLFSTGCAVCGSREHATNECPHEFFSTKCVVCGSMDHASKDCPHGILSTKCAVCGSKNHGTKNCPHGAFATKCSVCGSMDHATNDCPHGAFSTECSVCGSKNHASKDCPQGVLVSRTSEKHQNESYSSSSGEGGLTDFFGKIIGWIIVSVIVAIIVIMLAMYIVLPIALLNSALIFTISAIIFRKRKTIFAILALVGGFYMLLDIVNGWFSVQFVDNVVKNPNWISGFVYANSIAIGLSTWLLVQPIWLKGKLISATNKNKSLFAFTSSIIVVALMSVSPPVLYHSIGNAFVSKSSGSIQQLEKFEGSYLVPANEIVEQGELIFKVIDSKLIGICEQRVNPMGGLSKRKYEVTSLNSKSEGKYIYSYIIYDRFGGLLQESPSVLSGEICFFDGKVKIGDDYFLKIITVAKEVTTDKSNILSPGNSFDSKSMIPEGWRIPNTNDIKEGSGWQFFLKQDSTALPYSITGDFNGDGNEDSAWFLIKSDNSSWALLAFLKKQDNSFTTYIIDSGQMDLNAQQLNSRDVSNHLLQKRKKGMLLCSYYSNAKESLRFRTEYNTIATGVYEVGSLRFYYFDKEKKIFVRYSECDAIYSDSD